MATKNIKGGKVLEIVTQLEFLDEEKIKKELKRKIIKDYAYILHDKDIIDLEDKNLVSEEAFKRLLIDEKKGKVSDIWENVNGERKVKSIYKEQYIKNVLDDPEKKAHWHILLYLPDNYTYVNEAAKWFGVPENFVRVKRTGRGGKLRNTLLDCVEYMTHEDLKQQELGKHRYQDEEIKASFDFRSELSARTEEKRKYGKSLTDRERLQLDVLYNGLTLKQAMNKDSYNYNKDMNILKRNRGEYLSNQTPPPFRLNLYICGKGGVGKDLMAEALARSMYPQFLADDEIYFKVGAKGAEFEYYDGQPVLIWSDVRAGELVQRWGRENLLAGILDPFPTVAKRQNVKYSSVSLINSINIFTGADSWEDFLNGLVGEYKDKNGRLYESENKAQSYRRFPLVIPVYQSEFDIMLNKGFLDDNKSWEQYNCYQNIRGSFSLLAKRLSSMPEIREKKVQALVEPVKEQTEKIYAKGVGSINNDEEIDLSVFDNYGVIEKSDFERELATLNVNELGTLFGEKKDEYSKCPFDDNVLNQIKAIEREIYKRQRG